MPHTKAEEDRDVPINSAIRAVTGHKTSRMLAHYTRLGKREILGSTEGLCGKVGTRRHGQTGGFRNPLIPNQVR